MRRRFRYRLARVRRVREIEEQIARAAWSNAEADAVAADGERKRRSDGLREARAAEVRRMARGELDASESLIAQTALDGQLRALASADERALTRRAQASALATEWQEREKKRRALEELEKRARERHRNALQALENAQMDEIAGLRAERLRRLRARTSETDSSHAGGSADEAPVPDPSQR